ncbi:microtubule-associated protein 10 [Biomphalaria glabrata]|nr:microtubule-associated protein 10 [Biomphalaria glabrata]
MPGNLLQEKTGDHEVSLFSLEVVVEKVYIPHSPCRFPAVAFRLLDFPTILIKHVEDDLGKAIRDKISADPYYNIPNQFIELKDKHGNFMIKKGKSCLFKISADVLKQHLASTPLYVMIIDLFPEVPKLVGNSSIPLNSLIESICIDIIKLGSTVPSVHGDKGLFKIYNLMGKEIGYFVLGFRLLCLGPSLIPHLPDSALVHQGKNSEQQFDQLVDELREEKVCIVNAPQSKHKHSSSMTEPLQQETVERKDKEIHVNLETVSANHRDLHSASTQTENKIKVSKSQNVIGRWIKHVDTQKDENDLIINNIICPPPMFYNSKASPALLMQNCSPGTQFDEDLSVNELSEIESFDGFGLHYEKHRKTDISKHDKMMSTEKQLSPKVKNSELYIPQAREGEIIKGLKVAPRPETIFPLLTALIKELSHIQNPQLLMDVSNKLQTASTISPEQQAIKKTALPENEKLPLSIVSAVASALTKKFEASKPAKEKDSSVKQNLPVQLKNVPGADKKTDVIEKAIKKPKVGVPTIKGKLVFGLTHTQRLRLQKTNPEWLKLAEKEMSDLKAKQHSEKKRPDMDDINATTFSDTLTEVRRLAEQELNTPAALGDTLQNVSSEQEFGSTADGLANRNLQHKLRKKNAKTHTKSKHFLKARHNKNVTAKLKEQNKHRQSSLQIHSSSVEIKGDNSDEDQFSVQSSRSRSIEVRLPSAEPESIIDASPVNSDSESDSDEDIPLPDDSMKEPHKSSIINFSKYLSRSSSAPESIHGAANSSLNISSALDENSPLESTRHSKSVISDKNDSHVFQSTDYDTHQFLSTEEPELQGLASGEDLNLSESLDTGRKSVPLAGTSQKFPVIIPQLSESSPVPSVRRSHTKIDLGNLSHLASASYSKDLNSSKIFSPKSREEMKSESQKLNPHESSRIVTPKLSIHDNRVTTPKLALPDSRVATPKIALPDSRVATPKLAITPRSVSSSPRQPKPHPRKTLRESIHTDSISSYMPSDPDNVIVSLSTSNSGNYSEDFLQVNTSGTSEASSVEQLPNIISSAKLGYTIN